MLNLLYCNMIISLLIYLLLSYCINSFFRSGICFFLSLLSLIILNIEILSVFKIISCKTILISQIIELFIFLLLMIKYKKFYIPDFTCMKNKIFFALKLDRPLCLLAFSFCIMLLISFIYSFSLPIDRIDDLEYHIFRTLVYSKNSTLAPFITSDPRNILLPFNSEIIYIYIYLFTNNYIFFRVVQFIFYIAGICSLYSLMTLFGFSMRRILWTIFILSSLVKFQLEIFGTETDIIVGSLSVMSVYLFFKFLKTSHIYLLFFSSLSLALSIGVKTTAWCFVFVLCFMFFILLFKYHKIRYYLYFMSFLIINFIVFSSYVYISNFLLFGNFLTNEAMYGFNHLWGGYESFIANIIRYFFDFIDAFGLEIYHKFNSVVIYIENYILGIFDIPICIGTIFEFVQMEDYNINEFGLNGLLGIILSSFISFKLLFLKVMGNKKKIIVFSLLYLILCIIIFSLLMAYMDANKRYLIAFLFTAAPILSVLYSKKTTLCKLIITSVTIFYLLFLPFMYIHLPNRKIYNNSEFTDTIKKILKKGNKIAVIYSESLANTYLEHLANKIGFSVDYVLLYKINDVVESYDYIITNYDETQFIGTISLKNDYKNVLLNNLNYDCGFAYRIIDKDFSGFNSLLFKEYMATDKYIHFQGMYCKLNEDFLNKKNFKQLAHFPFPYDLIIWKKL